MRGDKDKLRYHLLKILEDKDKIILNSDDCKSLAVTYNTKYRGYKSDTHMLSNVGGVIKETLLGLPYNVRIDYKNLRVIISKVEDKISEVTLKSFDNTVGDSEENVESIRLLPVSYKDYLPRYVPNYIPQNKELAILDAHMDTGVPLLFVGPKGTGKTLSVAYYAYMNNIPIIQFDCSENTKRQDLIGRFLLIGDEVVYELGILPKAIEIANQYGKAILVLEEINALTPNMQKVLNQILDWRKHVYIPEIGRTFYCNNDGKSKLLIVGTMNPSYYGGVYELNEDLRSRFAEYHFRYPDNKRESTILRDITDLPDSVIDMLMTLTTELRKGVERGELSYAPSTRDLVLFADVYTRYLDVMKENEALVMALKVIIYNRYDDEKEKDAVRSRIYSVFGHDVSGD